MNIELRRYGIVIKTTPVTGDKASIGSGADCDIMIEDPYLAAHVGDVVRRGESWYLVDAGTSLDGITRDGERIDDEAIVPGRVYSIGGFELVVRLPAGAPAPALGVSPTSGQLIPGTIMESVAVPRVANSSIPGTIMESVAVPGREAEIPRTLFEAPLPRHAPAAPAPAPQAVVPQPAAAPSPARGSSRRRILLISVLGMGLLLLLLLLVKGGDQKKEIATPAVPATTTVAVATAPPPAAVVAPPSPGELLAALEFDRALREWERQIAKADDPAIRARYAVLALEIGRIHAANRSAGATGYFERAVQFGPAGNEAVAEAKRRLGNGS